MSGFFRRVERSWNYVAVAGSLGRRSLGLLIALLAILLVAIVDGATTSDSPLGPPPSLNSSIELASAGLIDSEQLTPSSGCSGSNLLQIGDAHANLHIRSSATDDGTSGETGLSLTGAKRTSIASDEAVLFEPTAGVASVEREEKNHAPVHAETGSRLNSESISKMALTLFGTLGSAGLLTPRRRGR